MARNINVPFRVVQGTQAQIEDTIGHSGEVMFDTERKMLVAFDGEKRGGYLQGGAGNSVLLTTDQTIGGKKTFTDELKLPAAITIDADATPEQILALLRATDGLTGVNVQTLLAALAAYLPLTGGTMTNTLGVKGGNIRIINNAPDYHGEIGNLSYGVLNTDGDFETIGQLICRRDMTEVETTSNWFCLRLFDNTDKTKYADMIFNFAKNGLSSLNIPTTPPEVTYGKVVLNREAINRDYVSKANDSVITAQNWTFDPGITLWPSDIRHDLAWKLFDDAPDAVSNTIINNCWTAEAVQNYISDKGEDNIILSQTGYRQSGLALRDKKGRLIAGGNISVSLNFKDEPHGIAPNPIENTYTSHIDTLQASINRHPVKLNNSSYGTNYYLGGPNASDTADLWRGRGLSKDKPFATLPAVINTIMNTRHCGAYTPKVILLDDIILGSTFDTSLPLGGLILTSESSDNIKTIRANSPVNLAVMCGKLSLLHIGFNNISLMAYTNLAEIVITGNISVGGTMGDRSLILATNSGNIRTASNITITVSGSGAHTIHSDKGGNILIPCNFAGSFTGKKFAVTNGAIINSMSRGVNLIPGTIAGTVDETSHYI